MGRNFARWAALTAILLFASAPFGMAQTSTGEIDVTVVDSSGAVIPNATVIVKGAQTGNLVRRLKTGNLGSATAPLLPPATYDLDVEAAGFKR
ncbi:MAG: carboxypeptidase-like regulatory domain-containing protein, partial [Bryobacteraceae bacterium]